MEIEVLQNIADDQQPRPFVVDAAVQGFKGQMEDDRFVVGQAAPFEELVQQGIQVFHGNADGWQPFMQEDRRAVLLLWRQFDDADEAAGPAPRFDQIALVVGKARTQDIANLLRCALQFVGQFVTAQYNIGIIFF